MGSRLRILWKFWGDLPNGCTSRSAADRAMDRSKPSPIVSVFRQALDTFAPRVRKSQLEFDVGLESLRKMMNGLQASDVGLDELLLSPATWNAPDKAPCTYVELYENEHINMSIFILRPGFKMPLHDHPHMHGLLKVVSGAVNLRSFSEYNLLGDNGDQPSSSKVARRASNKRTLFAQVLTDTICKESSDTCVLTPYQANFHEIEALELPAAFLDILAPPYDTVIEHNGPRRCNYYRIINEISTNVVQLEEMRAPNWFYCDQAPYLGPLLI